MTDQLRKDLANLPVPSGKFPVYTGLYERCERAIAERDEAARDAARYQWLRVHSTQPSEGWSTHSNPESLDVVVDAAMLAART